MKKEVVSVCDVLVMVKRYMDGGYKMSDLIRLGKICGFKVNNEADITTIKKLCGMIAYYANTASSNPVENGKRAYYICECIRGIAIISEGA